MYMLRSWIQRTLLKVFIIPLHTSLIRTFKLQPSLDCLQNSAAWAHFGHFLRLSSLRNILDDSNSFIFIWKLSSLQLGMYQCLVHHDLIGSPPPNLANHLCTRNCSLNGILQFPHAGGVPSGATVLNADLHHLSVFPLCPALYLPA